MKQLKLLLLVINVLTYFSAIADPPAKGVKDYAVQLQAEVGKFPKPFIKLSWQKDSLAQYYIIYRKDDGVGDFSNPLYLLKKTDSTFLDTNIIVGKIYNYQVEKNVIKYDTLIYSCYGHIHSGIEFQSADSNGTILLLIDNIIYDGITNELNDYIKLLKTDGWNVITRKAPRSEDFNAKAVQTVKEIIKSEYANSKMRALLLIGKIPVPYSGKFTVDGHPDHIGAWGADCFYGDIDGNWKDDTTNYINKDFPRMSNLPGDGKFDNYEIASDVELEVGRIDFNNLNDFKVSEIELYKRYFQKNNDFRTKKIDPVRRALIDDKFEPQGYQTPFAADAWNNFPGFVGRDSVFAKETYAELPYRSYLWSYGCSSGSNNSAWATAYSWDYADENKVTNSIFVSLLGSYFGDWDIYNNLLRSAIGSKPSILTAIFGSYPCWILQPMSLGETIGYCTKITQNNNETYKYFSTFGEHMVHTALMGDPTLKLFMVAPPINQKSLFSNVNGISSLTVTWDTPIETQIEGYNIYRADNWDSNFRKINSGLIKETNYKYIDKLSETGVYLIKTVKLEKSFSGTYYNQSVGTIVE